MTGVSSGPGGSWRTGRRIRRALYGAVLVAALTTVCCGCTPSTSRGPPTGAHTAGPHRAVITVGAFDFPESVLLAHIYGDALQAKGFPVRVLPGLGSRELVDPALQELLIRAKIRQFVSRSGRKTRQQRDRGDQTSNRRDPADIPLSGHCSPEKIKGLRSPG